MYYKKLQNRIFSSFFLSISFFWLELCALESCMCFKELSLFIRPTQGFLWNTKTCMQVIHIINILFSLHKVLHNQILSKHSYLVCVETEKDARYQIKMFFVTEMVCTGWSIAITLEATMKVMQIIETLIPLIFIQHECAKINSA